MARSPSFVLGKKQAGAALGELEARARRGDADAKAILALLRKADGPRKADALAADRRDYLGAAMHAAFIGDGDCDDEY